MPPIRTIVFDDDQCIVESLLRTDLVSLQIDRAATLKDLRKAAGSRKPDLFLLHETAKFNGSLLLDELRKLKLSVPAILLVPAASSVWAVTLDDKRMKLLSQPGESERLGISHREVDASAIWRYQHKKPSIGYTAFGVAK